MTSAAYDDFSANYAKHAAQNPFQVLYDRPAILDLAGPVAGCRVLDIGCAAGDLSVALASRGADVTGIDLSRRLVDLATERFGGQARFRQGDLAKPLDFLNDDEIDLVTASLVLHYLQDWAPTLAELRRVLRPGGALVGSVHHPEDWHWFDETHYFETELVTDEWNVAGRPQQVTFYRRPLSQTFAAFRAAGFQVDQLVEPKPLPECETQDPRAYEILTTGPRYLFFRLVKPSGTP